MNDFTSRWVVPFYMKVLHGNYTHLSNGEAEHFVEITKNTLNDINVSVVEKLLEAEGWRERIVGAWFAGLKNWQQFENRIGSLLIESDRVYAGQGYCFALGRFAKDTSAQFLISYLEKYLPRQDCFYDQDWALSALIWIDAIKGTKYSEVYLKPNGLWEQFVGSEPSWSIDESSADYQSIMQFCHERLCTTD